MTSGISRLFFNLLPCLFAVVNICILTIYIFLIKRKIKTHSGIYYNC